ISDSPAIKQDRARKRLPCRYPVSLIQRSQSDVSQDAARRPFPSRHEVGRRPAPSLPHHLREDSGGALLAASRLERIRKMGETPFGKNLAEMHKLSLLAHQQPEVNVLEAGQPLGPSP